MKKDEKIAAMAIEILNKKYVEHIVYKWLAPLNVLEIVSAFEKAKKQLEKQSIKKRKEEETERINEKDIKGFTREDCD